MDVDSTFERPLLSAVPELFYAPLLVRPRVSRRERRARLLHLIEVMLVVLIEAVHVYSSAQVKRELYREEPAAEFHLSERRILRPRRLGANPIRLGVTQHPRRDALDVRLRAHRADVRAAVIGVMQGDLGGSFSESAVRDVLYTNRRFATHVSFVTLRWRVVCSKHSCVLLDLYAEASLEEAPARAYDGTSAEVSHGGQIRGASFHCLREVRAQRRGAGAFRGFGWKESGMIESGAAPRSRVGVIASLLGGHVRDIVATRTGVQERTHASSIDAQTRDALRAFKT